MLSDIKTPAILLDLPVMERNIKRFQGIADKHKKALWPMIKTHKSLEIAKLQYKHGAKGFLCGTLDECEALADPDTGLGMKDIGIMYAYPVANEPNISRVLRLSAMCNFILRIDSGRQAELLNKAAKSFSPKTHINYVVIINSGLNRLGIAPHEAAAFVQDMRQYENLKFKGISTHPGHVYDLKRKISDVEAEEISAMEEASKALAGNRPEIISTGSTPTFQSAAKSGIFNILHPGNYVFMDNIQTALNRANEGDCALTVLASVISGPKPRLSPLHGEFTEYIIDAGSKCLGDQAVHGGKGQSISGIESLGRIPNRPELILHSLSEEVGRIMLLPSAPSSQKASLKIGDKIKIIPNHSCSAANMTSRYVVVRDDEVCRDMPFISVDMRGNSGGYPFA